MTVQCVPLENTVLNNPSLRQVTVVQASTVQQTSLMESQACALAPMVQYRNPVLKELSLMRLEDVLWGIVKSVLLVITVR